MSNLLDDISDNIESTKEKGIFIKWVLILLPYIITGTFIIGGAWVTFKSKFDNFEKLQVEHINNIINNKKDVDENLVKINLRIDNTNLRIDRLYDNEVHELNTGH